MRVFYKSTWISRSLESVAQGGQTDGSLQGLKSKGDTEFILIQFTQPLLTNCCVPGIGLLGCVTINLSLRDGSVRAF